MRRARFLRVLAVACAVPLFVASCSGDDEPAGSTAPATSATTTPPVKATPTAPPVTWGSDLPLVDGGFGETPTITVPDQDPPTNLLVKVLHHGKGRQVETGDTLVADYLGVRWDGGETFDSSFDRAPIGFAIGVDQVIEGWTKALMGQTIGSRLLLVIPPDLAYGDNPPGDPIVAGDTLVFVVDILGAHKATETASGKLTPTEDDSYPAVTVLPKKPEIFVPPGKAPPQFVAIPVITGKGAKVEAGDTIVVQYVGVLWRNGKEFDSSWGAKPLVTQIGVGAVIAGWDQGLVGQTVGSRVMMVVPAKLAYQNAGSGDQIKPGDDLVFAVDILGAY